MPVVRRRYSAGWRNRCAPATSNRHDCTPFESTDLRELDAPTRRGRHRPPGVVLQVLRGKSRFTSSPPSASRL